MLTLSCILLSALIIDTNAKNVVDDDIKDVSNNFSTFHKNPTSKLNVANGKSDITNDSDIKTSDSIVKNADDINEFSYKFIKNSYNIFTNSIPTDKEILSVQSELANKTITLEDFFSRLIYSSKFNNSVKNFRDFVIKSYLVLLNYGPDIESLNHWIDFANDAYEDTNDLNETYLHVLVMMMNENAFKNVK